MTVVVSESALDAPVGRLAGELERWQVPGAEIAVVRDGEVLFAGGVGVRGVDDAVSVGPQTLFHHGSCGKAYTSLTAALLAAEGLLDLDAPVRRYVPELRLPDMTIADRVTTRDLLSHRSGLGRHDFTWIANPEWDGPELVRRLEHLPLAGDLRAQFSYSNLGYGVAGLAIGRAAGTDWATELHRRVFDACGMTRAWVDVRRTMNDADHAAPHVVRDGKPAVTLWRILSGAAPAGEVMTCATDAARWLLLHTGAIDDLPAEVVQSTHHLQTPTPAGMSPLAELRLYGYSMGWLVSTWRGRPMLSHTGGVDGFTTHTLVLTDDRIGVTVSVNQHLSSLAMAAALDLADALLGTASDQPWSELWRSGADDTPPAQRSPDEPAAARPPVHPLVSYAGVYEHAGYGELVVSVDGGGLAVRIGELDCTPTHRQLDTWDLRYEPLDVDLPLTFETDANGDVRRAVTEFAGEQPVTYLRRATGE